MFTRKSEAVNPLLTGSVAAAIGETVGPAAFNPMAPGAAAGPIPAPSSDAHEEGIVVVGRGTRMQGKIGDCRKLDVHGILEADVVADVVVIRDGGGIKGTVQTNKAQIYGVFEGALLVHDHLDIFKSGSITGDISYRTLSIETGGKLRGNIINREQEPVADAVPPVPSADIIPMKQAHGGVSQDGPLGYASGPVG